MIRKTLFVNIASFILLSVIRFLTSGFALAMPAFYPLFSFVFLLAFSLLFAFVAEKKTIFDCKLLESKKKFLISFVCLLGVWIIADIAGRIASGIVDASSVLVSCLLSSLLLLLPWILKVVVLFLLHKFILKNVPVTVASVIVSLVAVSVYFAVSFILISQTNALMYSDELNMFGIVKLSENMRIIGNVGEVCEMFIGSMAILSISFGEKRE